LVGSGTAISSETVWNDGAQGGATGGGVSDFFALPTWQSNANGSPSVNSGGHVGRGSPDVAADADPVTGYQVRVDDENTVVGGTSAVAPLMAALTALMNQSLGWLLESLALHQSCFHARYLSRRHHRQQRRPSGACRLGSVHGLGKR